MMKSISSLIRKTCHRIVRSLSDKDPVPEFPPDFEPVEIEIIQKIQPYTMTSPERIVSLTRAVRYVIDNNIAGDFVECGVWKGGSVMAMILTLIAANVTDRDIYLFDTFEGMSAPTENDISYEGKRAADLLSKTDRDEKSNIWAYSPLELVRKNVLSLGYDVSKIHFIKGRVEDTIPDMAPSAISLLRLDTDWYDSTYHELTQLFPRLTKGGVLILDDYGHWQGARKATDQYISEYKLPLFLSRIDYTGRIAVKP